MGAFWNPYGGIIVNDRRLSKREVSLLKRTWSKQLRFSEMIRHEWWEKTKKTIKSFFR